ncbi:unnamed protein product [Prorocentrum cordatum]|uniref:PDEase domain-containing protein n=1 Tax=Prorocentrum cordatum TaxID=2364126 RepID=A0ABN9SSV1_9DINO|nr:unnamed protein product [Polarella glacialis]
MKGVHGGARATNAQAPVVDRVAEALDLNQPRPAGLPRPEGAAAQEGQSDQPRRAEPEAQRAQGTAAGAAPVADEGARDVAMRHDDAAYYEDDSGEQLGMGQVREGIEREAKFMVSLDIGEVVERPRGKKLRAARLRHRKEGDGVRSRFVVKQFKDAQAGDFFACAPRAESARVLMAAALLLKHIIATTDFSVAFMHVPVEDDPEIHVEMPPECGMGNGFAALMFQELLERVVVGLGFEVRNAEPAVYRRGEKGIRVVVHADDPLASGPTQGVLDEFFDELARHLPITGRRVLGQAPGIYLGSPLQRLGGLIVEKSKPGYVGGILEAAGALGCKAAGAAGTRPDLAQPGAEQPLNGEEHAVCQRRDAPAELGRQLSEPHSADMKCLKHLLRYLSGAIDLAMVHRPSRDWKCLRGGADSDWAGCGLRHLGVEWLWLQQLVGSGQIQILKAKGMENPPDAGAKFQARRVITRAGCLICARRPAPVGTPQMFHTSAEESAIHAHESCRGSGTRGTPFPAPPGAQEWSRRCVEEFFAQGDREKARRLQPIQLFDRDRAPSLAKGQLGFLNFVVMPTWKTMRLVLGDEGAAPLDECLRENVSIWEAEAAQENEEQPVGLSVAEKMGSRATSRSVHDVVALASAAAAAAGGA